MTPRPCAAAERVPIGGAICTNIIVTRAGKVNAFGVNFLPPDDAYHAKLKADSVCLFRIRSRRMLSLAFRFPAAFPALLHAMRAFISENSASSSMWFSMFRISMMPVSSGASRKRRCQP